MKFAKELDNDLVPEWRAKYLDYKLGKKKLKAIENSASRHAHRMASISSWTSAHPTRLDGNENKPSSVSSEAASTAENAPLPSPIPTAPRPIPSTQTKTSDRAPRQGEMTRYGSIIGSPPIRTGLPSGQSDGPPSLQLPGPAIVATASSTVHEPSDLDSLSTANTPGTTRTAFGPDRQGCGAHMLSESVAKPQQGFVRDKIRSASGNSHIQPGLKSLSQKVLSLRRRNTTLGMETSDDLVLDSYRDFDMRIADFFFFLDSELHKIESFYKQKEVEATKRLQVLRQQLHIMRDQRLAEIVAFRYAKQRQALEANVADESDPLLFDRAKLKTKELFRPVDLAWDKAKIGRIGKTFQTMTALGTPTALTGRDGAEMIQRDYGRRARDYDVQYRVAKHKLKTAMAEYYRGLELLKSYAMVNRTAFRKINKKFDKTVNARPPGRYMAEKINKAYFVKNNVLDSDIHTIEDLYARYFEKGDRKTAIAKLRVKAGRSGEYSGNTFRCGLLLAAGLVLGVQGLVKALNLLGSPDPRLVTETSYLLQIYGGYFLMLLLSLLFCLACRVWHSSRINYQFIFEFDTRHNLDWRQLSEIPSLSALLLGLFMWLNFSRFAGQTMYTLWPVVLIGLSTVIIFLPLPIFYHKSRSWLATSLWRLSLAGIYPVEFRDFFLGDLFCSETYAVGNSELFFCLYAQHPIWKSPTSCNSSSSRLLGFLTTLPAIWRALQCLRRYHDTRRVFPHLVNCGKYIFTILYYMSLSVYRITPHTPLMAMFITFASINAVYSSAWDIVMDWSLLDPQAENRLLRQTLAYDATWPYYLAMVIDPIIRFNWILYAVYTHNLQHSTKIAFIVGLTEVCRRGMWIMFRVENEHCSNVGRFRASRDVPLPYDVGARASSTALEIAPGQEEVESTTRVVGSQDDDVQVDAEHGVTGHTTGIDLERAASDPTTVKRTPSLRRRKTVGGPDPAPTSAIRRVGEIMREAHAQDFERRRKPELGVTDPNDEDDEDDDGDDIEEDSWQVDEGVQSEEESGGSPDGDPSQQVQHSLGPEPNHSVGNEHGQTS